MPTPGGIERKSKCFCERQDDVVPKVMGAVDGSSCVICIRILSAVNDLVGGHLDMFVGSLPQMIELVRSRSATGIAVTGPKRIVTPLASMVGGAI